MDQQENEEPSGAEKERSGFFNVFDALASGCIDLVIGFFSGLFKLITGWFESD